MQPTYNATRAPPRNKTEWSLYINFFLEITLEKKILNVQLIKRPMTNDDHR